MYWKTCYYFFLYIWNSDNFFCELERKVSNRLLYIRGKNNILIGPRRDIYPKRDSENAERRWWMKARRKYSDDSSRGIKLPSRCLTQSTSDVPPRSYYTNSTFSSQDFNNGDHLKVGDLAWFTSISKINDDFRQTISFDVGWLCIKNNHCKRISSQHISLHKKLF